MPPSAPPVPTSMTSNQFISALVLLVTLQDNSVVVARLQCPRTWQLLKAVGSDADDLESEGFLAPVQTNLKRKALYY